MVAPSQGPPLPGFGIPLGWQQQERDRSEWPLFRSALNPDPGYYDRIREEQTPDTWRLPMITLREVYNDLITEKWKAEMLASEGLKFTHEMVEYCIEELKYKAKLYNSSQCISLFHRDVVKSDNIVPLDLQNRLKAEVAHLENVPEHKKDWHPGSDGRVLDLVHPSLYSLVYGLSRIVTNETLDRESGIMRCGEGVILPTPEVESAPNRFGNYGYWEDRSYSDKFQWLPCDVDISGSTPRIVSYINNLHPQEHLNLYSIMEHLIAKIIPMWDLTLTPFRQYSFQRRIQPHKRVSYGKLDDQDYALKVGPQKGEGESQVDFISRLWEWRDAQKPKYLEYPNANIFERPQPMYQPIDLRKDYGNRGLQIIVKLANIHLTPEKSRYEGGLWHIEGKLNEHICASAIYYYDNRNVTPSHLAFRQPTNAMEAESTDYEQNDFEWLEKVFGLKGESWNEGPAIQYVGSVETREGRIVTFPNILQHQVQPFELEDSTKPGHRKVLALFLVDPNTRIISTANVPCQQRHWWARSFVNCKKSRFVMLPVELREKIIAEVEDFPVNLEKAKELRGELMKEREKFELFYGKNFEDVSISLCEH